jgi:hypothetical protein
LFYKKSSEQNIHKLNSNFSSSAINLSTPFINNCNFYFNNTNIKSNKISDNNIPRIESKNIIVADDEIFTRLSTIRTLKRISKSLGLNLNILEAEDGLETIYLVYKAFSSGSKISLIFSDESMSFIDGVKSSNIIKDILEKKKLPEIPFYLITAYEGNL